METKKQYSLATLFLGGLCIALGILFLISNSGLLPQRLYFSPHYLVPLFIIYLGLLILPIRSQKAYVLGAILIIIIILSVSALLLRGRSSMPFAQDDWSARRYQIMRDRRVFHMNGNEIFQEINWRTY